MYVQKEGNQHIYVRVYVHGDDDWKEQNKGERLRTMSCLWANDDDNDDVIFYGC